MPKPNPFVPPLQDKLRKLIGYYNPYGQSKSGKSFSVPASLIELEHKFTRGAIYEVKEKDDSNNKITIAGTHGELTIYDEENFDKIPLGGKYKVVGIMPNISNKRSPYKIRFELEE